MLQSRFLYFPGTGPLTCVPLISLPAQVTGVLSIANGGTGLAALGSGVAAAFALPTNGPSGFLTAPNAPGQYVFGPTGAATEVPVYDVAAYGASSSASASVNAVAFQSAFTAAASGGRVHVPCASYNLNATPSVTVAAGAHFDFDGDGTECSIINMQGAINGPTINYTNQWSSSRIANLTVTTNQIGGVKCLITQGAFTNPNSAYASASSLENVTVRGADLFAADTEYCGSGYYDNSISNVSVVNYSFNGIAARAGIPLDIHGSGTGSTYAVQIQVVNSNISNCATGVNYGDWVQGVLIANSNITGCDNGVIVGTSPSGTLSGLQISNSQIAAFACDVCINDVSMANLQMTNNQIIVFSGAIGVKAQGSNFTIASNEINGVTGATNGVLVGSTFGNGGIVSGNHIINFSFGAQVLAASQASVHIDNNDMEFNTADYSVSASSLGAVIDDNNPRNFSTLPTCNSATKFSSWKVADVATATFNATVSVGGGINFLGLKCDGTRYYVD